MLKCTRCARVCHSASTHIGRLDLRTLPEMRGRSINLALSARGLASLKAVGLEHAVQPMLTPMSSRMIHDVCGSQHASPYGVFGEVSQSAVSPLGDQFG